MAAECRLRKCFCYFLWAAALTLGTTPVFCIAQQVGFVDLTHVAPHTELRRPALTDAQAGSGRLGNIHQIHECSSAKNTSATLQTTLVSLDRPTYRIGDHPKFELQIENVGSVPIRIPFSPDLANLQPADPGQKFAYYEMVVEVWVGGAAWSANTGGMISMYGNDDHPGTILALGPGEWVCIAAAGNIALPHGLPDHVTITNAAVSRMNARTRIYHNETLVTGNASATVSHGLCLNQTQGPDIPVQISQR